MTLFFLLKMDAPYFTEMMELIILRFLVNLSLPSSWCRGGSVLSQGQRKLFLWPLSIRYFSALLLAVSKNLRRKIILFQTGKQIFILFYGCVQLLRWILLLDIRSELRVLILKKSKLISIHLYLKRWALFWYNRCGLHVLRITMHT